MTRRRTGFEVAAFPGGASRTRLATHGHLFGFGAVCLAVGAALAAAGARQWKRERARLAAVASHSPDAWTHDYGWTPGTSRDRTVGAAWDSAFGAAMYGALIAAVLFCGYVERKSLFSVSAALVIAGAVAVHAYKFTGKMRRGIVFGRSVLLWKGSPLRPGAEWTGTIEVLDRVKAPLAHLQFIKEVEVVRGSGRRRTVTYERRAHDRVDVATSFEPGPGRNRLLRVTALIPADAPSTELSADPARYWELFVSDEASDWAAAFLVPVYR